MPCLCQYEHGNHRRSLVEINICLRGDTPKLACILGKYACFASNQNMHTKKYIHSILAHKILAMPCLCQYEHGNHRRSLVEINIYLRGDTLNLTAISCTETPHCAFKLPAKKYTRDNYRPNFGCDLIMILIKNQPAHFSLILALKATRDLI